MAHGRSGAFLPVMRSSPGFTPALTTSESPSPSATETSGLYLAVLDQMNLAFHRCEIITDAEGRPIDFRLLEVNAAWARTTGFDAVTSIGKTGRELAPQMEPRWIEACGRAALQRESQRLEQSFADLGKCYDVHLAPFGPPEARQFLAVAADITPQKRVEAERVAAMEQAEAAVAAADLERRRLAAVVEQLPVGVVVAEAPSGRIVQLNGAVQRIWGRAAHSERFDRYGTDYVGFHLGTDRPYASEEWPLARAILHGETVTDEVARVQWPDGTERFVSLSASPVRDASGDIVGGVVTSLDVTARAEVERALAETRRRLEASLLAGEVGTFEWDTVRQRVWGDENFNHMFGIAFDPDGSAPLDRYIDVIHPDDRAPMKAAVARTIEQGDPYEIAYRVLPDPSSPDTAGDEPRWLLVRAKPVTDDAGRVVHASGVCLDITARKRAEDELQRNAQMLQAISESTGDVIYAKDRDGRLTYGNPATFALIGRPPEETLGFTDAAYLNDKVVAANVMTNDRIVIETGVPHEFEEVVPLSDGSLRVWSSSKMPYRDADGAVVGLLGVSRDITARKQAAERLAAEELRARFLLQVDDATRSLEDAGEILRTSLRLLREQLGADRCVWAEVESDQNHFVFRDGAVAPGVADVSGRYPISAFGRDALQALREGRSFVLHDVRQAAPDADRAAYEASDIRALIAVPLRKGGGGGTRLVAGVGVHMGQARAWAPEEVALVEAVTQRCWEAVVRARLLADEQAARAEAEAANRAKSEFLAVMSHELRTPLNAIGGYAELMEMGIRGPVTAQQRDDLRRIQASQRHLLGLINEVLNYARVETGAVHYELTSVRVVDLLHAAEALVAPQAQARGLTLSIAECDRGLAVRADAEKLRQVLVNLLSNAVKFTDRGGEIAVACTPQGDRMEVTVRDTGVGIALDQRERIFDPFVQVRSDLTRLHEGTGLGLAISRDLARGMGGDLVVDSEPGAGSCFTIIMPRA
jgi:PAS domain S-box-containing protein